MSHNKHISSILQIHRNLTFEDALAQAKIIKKVKIQEGEIKLRKKDNKQNTHNNGGNFNQPQSKPQINQITYAVNQAQ